MRDLPVGPLCLYEAIKNLLPHVPIPRPFLEGSRGVDAGASRVLGYLNSVHSLAAAASLSCLSKHTSQLIM